MKGLRFSLSACCLLLAASAAAEDATLPSASELSPGVWGVLASPSASESCPGVVLLHGASGWRPAIAALATDMADSGYVALTLDYYADAGAAPRGSTRLEKWPAYQEAVRRAVSYLDSVPGVSGQPVALVGFSRGAFLAVSVASSLPSVAAVVDFYGGGGAGTESIDDEVQGLPALLILHGETDTIVPVAFAEALRDAVLAVGGEVETHIYPGAGHGFNAPNTEGYSREATTDSYEKMMEFLMRHLKSRKARAG